MTSPHGPSGGNDPQQWGQQPYGGGYGQPGGVPGQYGQYGQPDPTQQGGQYGGGQYGGQPGYGVPQQPGYPGGYGQQVPYGQQPGYPGGYGQPGFGGPAEPKKKSALPWIIVGIVVVLLGVVAILGFVAPGFFNTKVFDQTAVQDGVKEILTSPKPDGYAIGNVDSVSCPNAGNTEVKKGNTFTCEVKIGGKTQVVSVSVKTDDGAYEVSLPKAK